MRLPLGAVDRGGGEGCACLVPSRDLHHWSFFPKIVFWSSRGCVLEMSGASGRGTAAQHHRRKGGQGLGSCGAVDTLAAAPRLGLRLIYLMGDGQPWPCFSTHGGLGALPDTTGFALLMPNTAGIPVVPTIERCHVGCRAPQCPPLKGPGGLLKLHCPCMDVCTDISAIQLAFLVHLVPRTTSVQQGFWLSETRDSSGTGTCAGRWMLLREASAAGVHGPKWCPAGTSFATRGCILRSPTRYVLDDTM